MSTQNSIGFLCFHVDKLLHKAEMNQIVALQIIGQYLSTIDATPNFLNEPYPTSKVQTLKKKYQPSQHLSTSTSITISSKKHLPHPKNGSVPSFQLWWFLSWTSPFCHFFLSSPDWALDLMPRSLRPPGMRLFRKVSPRRWRSCHRKKTRNLGDLKRFFPQKR